MWQGYRLLMSMMPRWHERWQPCHLIPRKQAANKPSPWGKRNIPLGMWQLLTPLHGTHAQPSPVLLSSLLSLHVNMCFVIAICAIAWRQHAQTWTHANSESLFNLFGENRPNEMSGGIAMAVVWLTRDLLSNEDLFPWSILGSLYMP